MFSIGAATVTRRVPFLRWTPPPMRTYVTSQSANPTSSFYKTFSRPIAKVLILAVFTYQVAYWTWTKQEADEARANIDAEIATLERKVNEYKESTVVENPVAK